MVALQTHPVHQLQWRQGLTYHGVSRKISAILAVVHGMLTMNPRYRGAFSVHGNPANVLASRRGRVT